MVRRKRSPEVLWRLFGTQTRTLADTIISLLPHHCDCTPTAWAKCLRCTFGVDDEAVLKYLIRPDDPQDYRRFMLRCFVVVPTHAPLPDLLSFSLRWPQSQIVERVILTFFSKKATKSNLICSGYEKYKMSSSIAKLITCSVWDLAWRRVGDCLMNYILMHTLIFMPINHKGLLQVTGVPANSQILRFPSTKPDSMPSIYSRHLIKRKRVAENDSTYELPSKIAKLSYSADSSEMVVCKEQCNEELGVNQREGSKLRLPRWKRKKRIKMAVQQNSKTEEHFTKVANDDCDLCNSRQSDMSLLCPFCRALQSLSLVPNDAKIKSTSILYNTECSSSLFLKCHIIYSLKPGRSGTRRLLRRVFGLSCTEKLSESACGSSCLYRSLMKALRVFVRRAKRFKHPKLLKKYCFAQDSSWLMGKDNSSLLQRCKMESEVASSKQESRKRKRTSEITKQQFGLPQPYCRTDQVVSFVWAVCRSIIPSQLLGARSFQRLLRENICRFIQLRRFEKFSLKQCMHRLDISKFPLLSNQNSSSRCTACGAKPGTEAQQRLLERWIFWLFEHIVVPLIRSHFYVTESGQGKQNLYYYQKPMWKKLSARATMELEGQMYRPLCISSVRSWLGKRPFGFSKVRLCPKETGARPIANLKAPSRIGTPRSRSHAQVAQKKKMRQPQQQRIVRLDKVCYRKGVNTVLRDLHVVFKHHRVKEPGKWGSAVSSYSDVHRKLLPFLRSVKNEEGGLPCVYIVVADVQKAFDTISQDKLLEIVHELQIEDEYTLNKSCEIFCKKNSMWTSETLKVVDHDTDNRIVESTVSVHQRSSHTILINQGHSKTVKSSEIEFILEQHVKCNILKLGQQYYIQKGGISQGSVLSSLLCSLYYGHLERNAIFPFLARSTDSGMSDTAVTAREDDASLPKYLLLRLVDDFLFISNSRGQAASFLARLQRGFREYNCRMNLEKFGINFDTAGMSWLDSKRILVDDDGASFLCWSGLLINCCSLEVQADYTRYLRDHLRSTLTVSWDRRPDRELTTKLCAYMRPKCHSIFFDPTINSPPTIRLNIYQAFLLCAMKFHCYVRQLSVMYWLPPKSCFTSIDRSIRYMYKLMKRRIYAIRRGSDCQPVLEVSKEEVIWLGLTAYLRVLERKNTRYKVLRRLLRAALLPVSRVGRNPDLQHAVDDSRSSILWRIRY